MTAVVRRVSIEYQSFKPEKESFHQKKQVPSLVSMLTRLLFFGDVPLEYQVKNKSGKQQFGYRAIQLKRGVNLQIYMFMYTHVCKKPCVEYFVDILLDSRLLDVKRIKLSIAISLVRRIFMKRSWRKVGVIEQRTA